MADMAGLRGIVLIMVGAPNESAGSATQTWWALWELALQEDCKIHQLGIGTVYDWALSVGGGRGRGVLRGQQQDPVDAGVTSGSTHHTWVYVPV